jgi:hypothetical protein
VNGEGSRLNLWIEDIKENKLCPSGISKLEGVRRRVGHEKVDNSDGWYKDHKSATSDRRVKRRFENVDRRD